MDGNQNFAGVDVDGAANYGADVPWTHGADTITASAGTSSLRAGVNAANSSTSGGNHNVVVGDEAGTALTTCTDNTFVVSNAGDALIDSDHTSPIGL